jgi:FlaA1/EpsC-like NDP-sugar epimerase
MPVVEAGRLVLHSAALAQPGQTYNLDMKQRLPIQRVRAIRGPASRASLPQDIGVVLIVRRAGERFALQPVYECESTRPTSHPTVVNVAIDQAAAPQDCGTLIRGLAMACGSSDSPFVGARPLERSVSWISLTARP